MTLTRLVRRDVGLINQALKAEHPYLGFSDRMTVKLDFDETDTKSTKYWANLTLEKFTLGGYVMLQSSKNCRHVVFDRYVSWDENSSIMAWVAVLTLKLRTIWLCSVSK